MYGARRILNERPLCAQIRPFKCQDLGYCEWLLTANSGRPDQQVLGNCLPGGDILRLIRSIVVRVQAQSRHPQSMEIIMTVFEAEGGCLCGAIRFQVTAKPLAAYYCHCRMCQRNGTGPFAAGATVPIDDFTFTKGKPAAYESSPGLMRLFCGTCGSPLGM